MIDRLTTGVEAKVQKPGLAVFPHDKPRRSKRSPAPIFHCASRTVRLELLSAYRLFVAAFREASARLNRGDPLPGFPPGSFPPSLPFVASSPA
jgi:hypothetical protein